jgi:hypothetical protein
MLGPMCSHDIMSAAAVLILPTMAAPKPNPRGRKDPEPAGTRASIASLPLRPSCIPKSTLYTLTCNLSRPTKRFYSKVVFSHLCCPSHTGVTRKRTPISPWSWVERPPKLRPAFPRPFPTIVVKPPLPSQEAKSNPLRDMRSICCAPLPPSLSIPVPTIDRQTYEAANPRKEDV